MKKIFFYSFFIITQFTINAQSYEQDFLDSLPQEFKDSIVIEEEAERNLQNPDSKILKLETALEEAEVLLRRIRFELDNQDEMLLKGSSELDRFGDRFFRSFQSTYLPINEPNLNDDYILDSGDLLTIQLVGPRNDTFDLLIERDGSINIPEIGKVQVAGQPRSNAFNLITSKINQAFIGVTSFITISEVRDMNVLIVGNVMNPGMYTLSGGSSILSLLYAAGGVNENGSYRAISHKRGNKLLQTIDLYDLFLFGNFGLQHSLRSGDVIFVNPSLSEIRISGNVSNPGIYEISNSSFSDFISFLGLYSQNDPTIIHTSIKNNMRSLSSYNLSNIDDLQLSSGDSIEVLGTNPNFKSANTVSILGEVAIPGEYIVSDGLRLSELISMAGGYTNKAYSFGGVLLRKNSADISREYEKELKQRLIDFITSLMRTGSGASADNVLFLINQRFEQMPKGRTMAEFDLDKLANNPELDILIQEGDQIFIPQFENVIHVAGQVMSPSTFVLENDLSSQDYLKLSGIDSKYAENVYYLVAPNGTITKHNIGGSFTNLFSSLSREDENLYPGSVIYAPSNFESLQDIEFAATIAPIFSSLALSLASLNTLSN